MTHPTFDWRGLPSELSKDLQPHKGNTKPGKPITLAGSRHGGAYSKAIPFEPTDEQVKGADSMFGML
jgi:hypothetical protein